MLYRNYMILFLFLTSDQYFDYKITMVPRPNPDVTNRNLLFWHYFPFRKHELSDSLCLLNLERREKRVTGICEQGNYDKQLFRKVFQERIKQLYQVLYHYSIWLYLLSSHFEIGYLVLRSNDYVRWYNM